MAFERARPKAEFNSVECCLYDALTGIPLMSLPTRDIIQRQISSVSKDIILEDRHRNSNRSSGAA